MRYMTLGPFALPLLKEGGGRPNVKNLRFYRWGAQRPPNPAIGAPRLPIDCCDAPFPLIDAPLPLRARHTINNQTTCGNGAITLVFPRPCGGRAT
jgi:hypothetical protein